MNDADDRGDGVDGVDEVGRARRAVQAAPSDEAAWHHLAITTARARRWDDLANAMSRAVDRFPAAAWVWEHLVHASLGLGDPDDAMRVGVAGLRAIAQRAPSAEDAGLWRALAHAWWRLGAHDSAREAAHAARSLDGDARLADLIDLRVAVARGDHAAAAPLGERMVTADPDALEPLSLWVAALLQRKDGRRALPLCARLERLDPTSPTVWTMSATAHALVADFPAAADAQARAVALAPDDRAAVLALGVYQLAAGRPAEHPAHGNSPETLLAQIVGQINADPPADG